MRPSLADEDARFDDEVKLLRKRLGAREITSPEFYILMIDANIEHNQLRESIKRSIFHRRVTACFVILISLAILARVMT